MHAAVMGVMCQRRAYRALRDAPVFLVLGLTLYKPNPNPSPKPNQVFYALGEAAITMLVAAGRHRVLPR